jgi:hypothetical protein
MKKILSILLILSFNVNAQIVACEYKEIKIDDKGIVTIFCKDGRVFVVTPANLPPPPQPRPPRNK